jgi:hypothetical protein
VKGISSNPPGKMIGSISLFGGVAIMENIKIVKVVHREDAPVESDRWMRRLIINVLLKEIGANLKDAGQFLQQAELNEVD